MSTAAFGGLVLTGELSIYEAAEMRPMLLDWCQQCEAVAQLDLSAIAEMDSAGLQLLLSLERTLVQQGKALHITAASPTVQEVLALAGLTHWLERTEVQA